MNANKIEQLSNFCCEKFVFDSNFDSGNLLKVELAKRSSKYHYLKYVDSKFKINTN